jgi:hypothetical protein
VVALSMDDCVVVAPILTANSTITTTSEKLKDGKIDVAMSSPIRMFV